MSDVKVCVSHQGDAQCHLTGYMLKRGENVVAFYIDAIGRAYPTASSSSVYFGDTKTMKNCPSLTIIENDFDDDQTEIYFPEFEGWSVHSTTGGKTMSICLTKD